MLGSNRFLAKRRRTAAGRPRGEVSDAVIRILRRDGPLTAREVADRLQLTGNIAKFTCSRLHARGEITVVDTVRVPGANKPVRRYDIAMSGVCQYSDAPSRLPAGFFAGRSS